MPSHHYFTGGLSAFTLFVITNGFILSAAGNPGAIGLLIIFLLALVKGWSYTQGKKTSWEKHLERITPALVVSTFYLGADAIFRQLVGLFSRSLQTQLISLQQFGISYNSFTLLIVVWVGLFLPGAMLSDSTPLTKRLQVTIMLLLGLYWFMWLFGAIIASSFASSVLG